jgi:hypothetical protein
LSVLRRLRIFSPTTGSSARELASLPR